MSEDRDKHDRAGGKDQVKGHAVGKGKASRQAEMRSGMSQHIPDKTRDKIDKLGKEDKKK